MGTTQTVAAESHGFLAAGGEMARRIAAHDWAATTLGPIDDWPPCLKHTVSLMLGSPVPMVLLWGQAGAMIYNDGYAVIAGGRDHRLLGSNVLEGWEEVADFNANVMRVGLAGGTLSYRDTQMVLHRDGAPETVTLNLDYSPVRDGAGRPVGVLAVVVETTASHRNRMALEESEKRLRFLDRLSHAVVDGRSAQQVLDITASLTGQHLALSHCAYADMEADQDGFTIRGGWQAPGSPSITGRYRLSDFGDLPVQELRAGRALVVNDAAAELPAGAAQALADLGIRATICMPLLRDGRLTALMAVHHSAPHHWTDAEAALIREVTERSWAHVQRVGAEGVLQEREGRHRQILDSAVDYGIVATDMDGRITLWNRGAQEMLGWDEAEMLGQPLDTFFTPEDSAAGRPAAKRAEALASGRAQDARWHVTKSGHRFWGLSEMTPLRDEGGTPIGFVKLIRDRTAEYEAQEALRLSEDRLRRAQAAGGVGLFSLDIVRDTINATPEFCRIFGIEPVAELPADWIERLVLPEDAEWVSTNAARRSGDAPMDVEYRIRKQDTGEERVIARKAEFEHDSTGAPVRMVGAVRDVTDRRRIKAALEKSEAQFSALAQNMPNQVWTARADGTLDWFNNQTYAYTGLTRGQLDGSRWGSVVHPDDVSMARTRWANAVAGGDVYEVEFRLRDASGRYRWHLARAVPLTDRSGRISAWVGTNTEIEAQKQAEAAHAKDRERLWTISQDLMLVCEVDGRITAINPSVKRLLGWEEEDLIGRRISEFIHPDDLANTEAELTRIGQGSTTLAFENRYLTRDGDYRLFDWTAVPDGERIHAVGRDITTQRAIEEALRQSQKMEAVGQLTGGIAHDFNNLLQGITGSINILQRRIAQGRTEELGKWIEGARSSAERAAALTHRLLAFSRRQPLDPRPVQVNPLVLSMEDLLRRTMGERLQLKLDLAPGLWLTRCDGNQLESAILNLAINARDAMPDGGQLTIASCNVQIDASAASRRRDLAVGDYVCISVTDTGTGMSRDVAERAFEPFFTTKPIGQGTGLGLSMIYGFARQSEGGAEIVSEPGKGTTINLYLPRCKGEDEVGDDEETVTQPPEADAGEVVLVVEDEAVVRILIIDVLSELGYTAVEASDGKEALAVLQSDRRIDLVVSDIGLPGGLNGRQVVDAARVLRPDLKVLFMTGYAENATLASGFLEPGMALITKPFDMDVLANRIRDIIEG